MQMGIDVVGQIPVIGLATAQKVGVVRISEGSCQISTKALPSDTQAELRITHPESYASDGKNPTPTKR